MKTILLSLSLLFFISISSNAAQICVDFQVKETESYKHLNGIEIESFDETKLSANLLIPKVNHNKKLPVIIFINSWTLEEHEYFVQALRFVKKGYLVLNYSTRGWGCSTGEINISGEKDKKDISKVIDWLENNTNVDIENIGLAGISYGAGLSLISAGYEPRVKTVVAMSGWSNLTESLLGGDTLKKFWVWLLVETGRIFGNLPDSVSELVQNAKKRQDMDSILEWAGKRGAVNYLDEINKAKKPIYIMNNFGDNLFQSNSQFDFFSKLKGPKRLDMNQGTHGTAELIGLLYSDSKLWKRVSDWFDYWLKNSKESSIVDSEVNFQIAHSNEIESIPTESLINPNYKELNLKAGFSLLTGSLKSSEVKSKRIEKISTSFDSLVNAGIPILSEVLRGQFRVPTFSLLPVIDTPFGIIFESDRLTKQLKLRGETKLQLDIEGKGDIQLVGYLYDTDRFGFSRLITHGVKTIYNHKKGVITPFELNFVPQAYNLKKGHKLKLIIDTFDPLYYRPPNSAKKVKLHLGKNTFSKLKVPIVD